MKNIFTIFYSWQSDIKGNRNFIQNCIEKALKKVSKKQQKEIGFEINIDRDTRHKSGSPAIANTIFRKIEMADIFVCDVTVINKNPLNWLLKTRLTPNPNVLIELGYAVHILGWERIICIVNTEFNAVEELPFDIRGHRITTFQKASHDSKDKLTYTLSTAIESIITNFEKILADQSKSSNKNHDLNIYKEINGLCSESLLGDSISVVVTDLFTNRYYLHTWDRLQEYYRMVINNFIDKELDDLMRSFLQDLNDLDTIVATYFHLEDNKDEKYAYYSSKRLAGESLTEDEEFDYLQSETFVPHKEPWENESWPEADKRIYKLQDQLSDQAEKVKRSYRNLIMKIKQTLM